MKMRKAYTLIELCITMSIGSALMLLAIGLLHQSLSFASMARSQADFHRTLNRLARDFRNDVHLASSLDRENPQRIALTLNNGDVVQYEAEHIKPNDVRIRRQRFQNEAAIDLEEYRIGSPVVIEFLALDQPRQATVELKAHSDSIAADRIPPRQITAVLGRRIAHERAEVSP